MKNRELNRELNKPTETTDELNTDRKFNPFYYAPNRMENESVVKKLTKSIGIGDEKKKTLKTEFIYLNQLTDYNGHQLTLKLSNDKEISLIVKKGTREEEVAEWSIKEMTKRMGKKNDNISEKLVVKLLREKQLGVNFNVKTKDHGTKWRALKGR